MKASVRRLLLVPAALLACGSIAACHPATRHPAAGSVQPATNGTASHSAASPSASATAATDPRANEADVHFMQGMIAHHAQAARMASLVPTRSHNDGVRTIAKRIDVSQRDEIRMMQRWLEDHHQTVPHPDLTYPEHVGNDTSSMAAMPGMAMSTGPGALMPGMLTPEQMAHLAAATGTEFDRLFLRGMIGHHQGALVMVTQLFATPGATEDTQVFEFATDIDAGQRAEIGRMRALLGTLPDSLRPRR